MKAGRTIALDLGKKRTGVAIDDELGAFAHPRPNLEISEDSKLVAAIVALAEREGAVRFIVGLPMDMSGREGDAARSARRLAQKIADATHCEVELWDERWTTVQALRELRASEVNAKRAKGKVDSVAACAILQAWLDQRGIDPR